jgi:hypothetical protein
MGRVSWPRMSSRCADAIRMMAGEGDRIAITLPPRPYRRLVPV